MSLAADGPWQQWLAEHGDSLIGVPLRILLIVVLAFALRLLAGKLINRAVARLIGTERRSRRPQRHGEATTKNERIAAERRDQRARTIGSILTSTTTVVIAIVAGTLILGELGVQLGPILASVGIVGLAVGFGAQSLVSDIVAGVFMLAEDQYGVGDWVDVGYASGTVEHVGLRVTQLRDGDGVLWFVRNGQIASVGNHAQDWARALLEVPIAYEEDIDEASQLLLDTARGLANDPAWSDQVLVDPEVWGVGTLSREAIGIQLAVITAPQRQWGVARELRHRIKTAFDSNGITIPIASHTVIHDDRGALGGSSATDPGGSGIDSGGSGGTERI